MKTSVIPVPSFTVGEEDLIIQTERSTKHDAYPNVQSNLNISSQNQLNALEVGMPHYRSPQHNRNQDRWRDFGTHPSQFVQLGFQPIH